MKYVWSTNDLYFLRKSLKQDLSKDWILVWHTSLPTRGNEKNIRLLEQGNQTLQVFEYLRYEHTSRNLPASWCIAQ